MNTIAWFSPKILGGDIIAIQGGSSKMVKLMLIRVNLYVLFVRVKYIILWQYVIIFHSLFSFLYIQKISFTTYGFSKKKKSFTTLNRTHLNGSDIGGRKTTLHIYV